MEGKARIERRKGCRDLGLLMDKADSEEDYPKFHRPHGVGCTGFLQTSSPVEAHALSYRVDHTKFLDPTARSHRRSSHPLHVNPCIGPLAVAWHHQKQL